MVLLRVFGYSFVLIIITSNILQGYGYSESQKENEKKDISNDASDSSTDEDSYSVKSRKGESHVFAGDCIHRPNAPENGKIKCSLNSGCIASCAPDYKFPNGMHQLMITCNDKEWYIVGTEWNSIPHCEPICMPKCQNNGICIAPHHCDCPEHFTGPQCQFEDKPCLNHSPPVLNSYKKCNSKSCTIFCMEQFTFPDGSSVANLICQNGSWKPTRNDWVLIPDCEPVCDPPCQNGGNCLPLNLCQCPQDYRGSQCQYFADTCDAEKLHFNGEYHCTNVADTYSCTLNCPTGVEFEFPPATAYICTYDKGIFEPQPIPQCKVDNNVKIISLGTSHNAYVQESNHSWSKQNFFGAMTKHSSKFHREYYSTRGSELSDQMRFNIRNDHTMIIEASQLPRPKTCFTWGGAHYKTFDDRIYSFDSNCPHVLLRETQNDVFTIVALNNPDCRIRGRCSKIVKLFVYDKEYTLASDKMGMPTFSNVKQSLPIPVYLPGLRVDKSARFILVTLDLLGVKLKWDGFLLLQIEASESMWNKTIGLCGTMNDDPYDEFLIKSNSRATSIAMLANAWRVDDIGETCDDYPSTQHACELRDEFTRDASEFCVKLLSDHKFNSCVSTINLSELTETCLWDYCACKHNDRRKCACDTIDVYVRQCTHKGITSLTAWRNNDTCPIFCSNGRVYFSCGPKVEISCGSNFEVKSESSECEEGCFCPTGTVEHQGRCVTPVECPCKLRGRLFEPGTSVPKGCNTCTCTAGKWICTQIRCGARCAVVGDPHYTTFDGKHYDFMGKCKYYLMKGENYTIESENVPCSGAISESMGFTASADSPSCTKTVTINFKNNSIKLKENRQVTTNGNELTKFPTLFDGTRIRIVSSIFLVIHLPNGLEVWWDGVSRVYINAPAKFHGQTKGLCGTFSENQKDDFVTPDGDIEPVAIAFANKWKTSEYCTDKSENEPKHPCELNPQKRASAEEYCSKIHTDIFSECHWYVDPTEFYRDCLYDMCACDIDIKSCLCPILAAYAQECAVLGVKLLWRSEIDECKIHCSGGQTYQICGNSCTRSCGDISFHKDCKQECVEGCNCPEGQTLDVNGECIPIVQCSCMHAAREYKPNHQEVRPGNKGREFCICINGIWECRLATPEEIRKYPPVVELLSVCLSSKHLEVTDCEPIEQRTCRNMHIPIEHSPTICTSGCICKNGYVLEDPIGLCIKKEDCPCHHGGKSYNEGSVIQAECNICTCEGTKWKCTDRTCAGVCSVWGDSHYKTFDGKMYDFQGICDYVLVKSVLNKEESFDISIQNVPCGTNGVACSKSIRLVIGNGEQQEELVLIKGKSLPRGSFKRMTIRVAGLFVFVDVPDLGLVLQWDKGTRIYVRLNPEWKGHTMGLCGDYNDNAEDDFKTPSGGISEASVNLFGDSWKKDMYCPESRDVLDTCEQHPERKLWSLRQCNVLKSPLFSQCHSEVEVEPYVRNCIFDACSCDAGGDCECLCTALAAYAHECNMRGVPVKWRIQELCPMQCDEQCSMYSPCISTCPRETCNNLMTMKYDSHLCAEDTCVEGCLFKLCPKDQVYWNASYTECVPKSMCKIPFCVERDGTMFYEGDRVSGDDCQSCFCSHGKIICKGEPCTSTTTSRTSVTIPQTEQQKCVDGWSAWINKDLAVKGKKFLDVEPLPVLMDLANTNGFAVCDKEHMIDIRCRTVEGHTDSKESGLDVECSLERGLYCQSRPDLPCIDFEISVLCRCFKSITQIFQDVTTEISTKKQEEDKEKDEKCDMLQSNSPHPTDCRLFYQCVPTLTGHKLIEKSCSPGTLYNSETQVCDWSAPVLRMRPECSFRHTTPSRTEWSSDTGTDYGNMLLTSVNRIVSTTKICQDDETWSECAIPCARICHYYRHILATQGHCNEVTDCISACVPIQRPICPLYKYWRDGVTCVDANDCPCKSHNGSSVAPGAVRKETDCEICQCINNYYTCDSTFCGNTTVTSSMSTSVTTAQLSFTKTSEDTWDISVTLSPIDEHTILLYSTITPPVDCDDAKYVPMIGGNLREEVTIRASSSKNPLLLRPEKLFIKSAHVREALPSDIRFWEPESNIANQWLDVEFGRLEPIYGVILQGAVIEDKFITSYKVLFSEDGQTFSYVLDHRRQPRVFRGPIDKIQPVEQRFYQPVEAKIIRINPLTWHNGIAMRIEVLGCMNHVNVTIEQPTIKTSIFEEVVKPVCEDPMGLDDGLMAIEQLSVSSSPQLVQYLPLSSEGAWHAALDNPHQYVQFDFLKSRNLTGITTKGGSNAWTTAYKIFYSNDERHWNPIIDENGIEKEFLGNFDSNSRKTNIFVRPLHARYLKIQPTKWHNHVALKVEVLGCYLPYPATLFEVFKSTMPSLFELACNVCNGIKQTTNDEDCRCKDPWWWDGESCVPKQECPCVVGHMPYAIGSVYETDDCQECVCALGGIAACLPKKCAPCPELGLQSIVSELCTCLCKPCATGTKHCPTSDVCINETAWCNGVQDCPDDETDCPQVISTTPFDSEMIGHVITTSSPTGVSPLICEEPLCPPNYKIVFKESSQFRSGYQPDYNVKDYLKTKSRDKGFTKAKGYRKHLFRERLLENKNRQLTTRHIQCPEFTCVPVKSTPVLGDRKKPDTCPEASCPLHYEVVYEKISAYKLRKCPKYACRPMTSQVAVCNITGRTFNTFDNMEYKYDVCNHILARDMYNNEWYITLEQQCDTHGSRHCTRMLVVTVGERVIVLYSNLHVDVNEYSFTAEQIMRFGERIPGVKLSRTGDRIVLISYRYGFWVIWDSSSNVKIGVTAQLMDRVDGLCGYYDGNFANDRQIPDGTQARGTVQFGNSWAMENTPECDSHVCPRDTQERAWTICNSVRSTTLLDVCSMVVDLDRFVSHCVESACTCLRGDSSYENCRCRLLTSFVTECEAAAPGVDLSYWRTVHDCPTNCPAPFVPRDCFRNKCETTCDNLHELEPCPPMQGICFPGCFCPDGLVRRNNECVPPVQCRDCACDSLGNSKFIDFNRRNFGFAGNCTYLLSRNIVENAKNQNAAHMYQVLISNGDCAIGTCTDAITLLYTKHVVQIKRSKLTKESQILVNDTAVEVFPYNRTWLTLDRTSTGDLTLLLPSIQLELVVFHQNFAFTLKLPSYIFGDATEGLCGNCNIEAEGFKKRDGNITDDTEEFGKSWLIDDLSTQLGLNNRTCSSNRQFKCIPPPADEDICRKLLDLAEFRQCHSIIDPKPYLDCCHDALCIDGNYCDSLQMYARKCSEASLCPAWRTNEICPYDCPKGLVYQPCASSCKKTCDTLNELDNSKCSSNLFEGCFCPDNHVFHNDSCIPRENCFVCDEDGHVKGDIWYPDKCTECSCHDRVINCRRTECPVLDTICEENMTPMLINETEERCCAKYLCVPKPTASTMCIEPQEPECGFGQTMKAIVDADGCHKFICQCLPVNECPVFDDFTNDVEKLEPGFVQVMNTSGCCPRPTRICDSETCPSAPNCPSYYNTTMTMRIDNCCPIYECVPPKDLCLYTIGDNEDRQYVIAKEIGEGWKDGKCKTCVCENSYDGPKSNCLVTECPSISVHPDVNDYILEEILLNDKCCPIVERTACRDGDVIYNVGESWRPDTKDACVMMQCDKHSDKIQKHIKIQKCNTECDYGYEYQLPNDTNVNCCGICVQVACIIEGTLKNVGEQWYLDDHCVTYFCESINGSIYVQASTEICPEIDPQLELEFEIEAREIIGKCCPEIVKTACRNGDKLYKPGERWRSLTNSCVTETCVIGPNITKHEEVEVCSKHCTRGWIYQESKNGKCCGECKQAFCILDDILYPPGTTWSSDDNCTTYTCMEQNKELFLSASPVTCPDIKDCPDESIYHDQCCKRCNLTLILDQLKGKDNCKVNPVDANSTIGVLVVSHPLHGKCKNLDAVEGIKQCSGACQSSTYFSSGSWNQISDCQCCQAKDYTGIVVNLTCDDGRRLKKQLATPVSCSCQSCVLSNIRNENEGTKVKG